MVSERVADGEDRRENLPQDQVDQLPLAVRKCVQFRGLQIRRYLVV